MTTAAPSLATIDDCSGNPLIRFMVYELTQNVTNQAVCLLITL